MKKDKMQKLDMAVSTKLIRLSRKYPIMCVQYLIEMHKVIDWAEKKLTDIKPKK